MKKMLFTRTSTPARGDGSGPTFVAGKAYWMADTSAIYWMGEGVVVEAPAAMPAENEPVPDKPAADRVTIRPVGSKGRFAVLVDGVEVSDRPLPAGAAEKLRKQRISDLLAPKAAELAPAAATAEPTPAPAGDLRLVDDYWWPSSDLVAHRVMPANFKAAIVEVMAHVAQRRVVLQAGGNAGYYPANLAAYFREVLTFEPEAVNFACLLRNTEGLEQVTARQQALGALPGRVCVSLAKPDNSGTGRVTEAPAGEVEMIRIDDLALPVCDLVWLSVNGYTLEVLRGAADTIARERPVVVVEQAVDEPPLALEWLEAAGYVQRAVAANRAHVMVPA